MGDISGDMKGPMTILITGAAGYVGRAAVAAARARGHHVVAVVRLAGVTPDGWDQDDGIELVEADLSAPSSVLALDMLGVDAVIHAAASLTGDDAAQARNTLDGTRHLLAAMAQADVPPRLVLVSSVAVYSGADLAPNGIVDETSALERHPDQRDAYCRAKLAQEQLAAETIQVIGGQLRVLRLGAVFGPDRLWNAHIGPGFGPIVLRLAAGGEIPLCHIANCAEALIRACEYPVADGPDGAIDVLNLIDDDLPDRVRFLNAMARTGWPRVVLPVSWRLFDWASGLLGWLPGRPGILRQEVLRARMQPLFYPNDRLKHRLHMGPMPSFEQSFAVSMGVDDPQDRDGEG
ncbi:NAD-dependent epimerase/dehydratase family protein [Thalassobius sp. S69A]|uniref:NAD-dependent epimerase/dehydratase family protein n=1 Tax=unclassified Thalassovita TaxID=2619711 RepID=UPI003C7EC373